MDIKFILMIGCAIIVLVLLMNEINSARNDIIKKLIGIESTTMDASKNLKRETNIMCNRFKSYTNEMVSQFRAMNMIERQPITVMSDQFVEVESIEGVDMPYLSEIATYDKSKIHEGKGQMSFSALRPLGHPSQRSIPAQRQILKVEPSEKSLYMSNTENEQFKIKDATGKLLPSVDEPQNVDEPCLNVIIDNCETDNQTCETNDHILSTEEVLKLSNRSVDSDDSFESNRSSVTNNSKQSKFSMKKITSYDKTDLIEIAERYNISSTVAVGDKVKNLTKKELYDSIVDALDKNGTV